MRRMDALIGRPLCGLLTGVRRLGPEAPAAPSAPGRILVIKLAEQGATVAAHAALARAAELVGRDNLYVAVFAENRFVLDELGIIDPDHVLTVRTTSGATLARDLLRLVRRCRRLGIDATVDLEFFSRISAILAFATGARRRSGLHSFSGEGPYRGDLLTHRVSANPLQHVSSTFLALVEALVQPVDRLPAIDAGPWEVGGAPQITPTPTECARVRAIVDERLGTASSRRLVLINPNTGDLVPLRRWPSERYVALAHELLARFDDVAVLVTGSPAEAPAAQELVAAIDSPRCASVAGATTMRELLVLYHLAEVLVTNDSGPAHYAGLTSIDVVALFGPETPAVFGPLGERSHALWAGVPCSPCVNAFNNRLSPCRDNICMQRISTDLVAGRVAEILAARA